MVLLNVKMQFTLAEALAEERRIAAMAEPLPICKSLLEEAVRLMLTLEASAQHKLSKQQHQAPLSQKQQASSIEDGRRSSSSPIEKAKNEASLNPVLPPKSPRPMRRTSAPVLATTTRFGLDGLLVEESNGAAGNADDKEVALPPSWALRGGKYVSQTIPETSTPSRKPTTRPSDLLTRAVYASLAIARFQKQWAKRIGERSMQTLRGGQRLVRQTSFKLKEHLKAYSVVEEIDRRLEETARRKLEREREAKEREHMCSNERLGLAVEMHRVDVREVFFVKKSNFLKVTTFMNHARDIMVIVARPTQVEIFPPLYYAEADLLVAANDFQMRASKFDEVSTRPIDDRAPVDDHAKLRGPPELPDYAIHYMFMLGRLTILDETPTLLGVENVVTPEAAVASRRVTTSALGDYTSLALEGWRPVNQGPDPAMKLAFVNALIEAKELVSGGENESVKLREIQRDLQQQTSVMQEIHERDAVVLNTLLATGVAPTQKAPLSNDNAKPSRQKAASKKRLLVRPTTAGAWRRAASQNRRIFSQTAARTPSLVRPLYTANNHTVPKIASETTLIKLQKTLQKKHTTSLHNLTPPPAAAPDSWSASASPNCESTTQK